MVNFLFLVILHVLGDFYFQTTKVAQCKNAKQGSECKDCKKCNNDSWINYKYLLLHLSLYIVPFLVLYFMTGWRKASIFVAALLISHGIIDSGACFFNKRVKQTLVFLADQFLHIGMLWLLYRYVTVDYDLERYYTVVKVFFVSSILIMPCSIVINKLFEDVYPDTAEMGIFDIGSIIGIMERILTIIFAHFGNFAAIAIIITIKTWARTGDLTEPEFRNKYLLGTLTSLVLAILLYLIYDLI